MGSFLKQSGDLLTLQRSMPFDLVTFHLQIALGKMAASGEFESVEALLNKAGEAPLSPEELKELKRVFYGSPVA